ncbi:MAG: universal stress protein [Desulfatirhabdiaceae bacterium]
MNQNEAIVNRNILIAVDQSENAHRAVNYVARLLGGIGGGFRVAVLHVILEPESDFFATPEEKENWLATNTREVEEMLAEYRQFLIDHGFAPENVSIHRPVRYCPSMAECIIAEQEILEYGTIVVGRKGMSRKEEMLFGSVSSKLVKIARNCAIWVIE